MPIPSATTQLFQTIVGCEMCCDHCHLLLSSNTRAHVSVCVCAYVCWLFPWRPFVSFSLSWPEVFMRDVFRWVSECVCRWTRLHGPNADTSLICQSDYMQGRGDTCHYIGVYLCSWNDLLVTLALIANNYSGMHWCLLTPPMLLTLPV